MFGLWQAHKRKITAMVLFAFPLLLMTTSAGAGVGDVSSGPMRIGVATMSWPQTLGAGILGQVNTWVASVFVTEEDAENERLREEVSRLREEKTRLVGVLQENERLRKLIGLRTRRPELELVPARIIARDTTPYFRVLKLEIDSEVELKPRMPVVVAEGVVGQIHRAHNGYADVIVLSDPRHRVDAISQRTRAQAIVEGLGHEADYRARLAFLREKDRVRSGDVMVTSGMDKVFPPDLVIGVIDELEERDSGLFQEATVTPAVDFGRLQEVFIIVGESK